MSLGFMADMSRHDHRDLIVAFKFIVLISFLFSVHTITVDVKPSNILVSTRGQVKLCDFGVSRQVYNYVVLSDKNLPNWFGVYPYLTSNFTVFFFFSFSWSIPLLLLTLELMHTWR